MVLSAVGSVGHDRQDDWVVEYVTVFHSICACLGTESLTMRLDDSIVAIHGLDEDHVSAWLDRSSGVFWLRDLLPQYIPSARILTYGYSLDTDSSQVAQSSETILQHAQTLVAELEADRSEYNASRRPLIFLCHGLGGVILKRALAYSASRVSKKVDHLYSISVSTYGILFFGTPHDASSSPHTTPNSPDPEIVDKKFAIAANYDPETLQDVIDHFAPLIKQFHIHFFWEQKNTFNGTWTGLVVKESSAAPILDDTERSGIWATHSGMCKFATAVSPGFSVVRATLTRYARDANELIANRWIHATEALDRLRRNEAAELLESYDPTQGSPVIYDKHPHTLRNKFFSVPYNASSIFTGRQDITERLERNILPDKKQTQSSMQKRFVLYGLGGSGKTQFCLKFIQDHRQK